jgi:8-oxo-dGTP diphosphatase
VLSETVAAGDARVTPPRSAGTGRLPLNVAGFRQARWVRKQINVAGAVIVRDGLILCAQRGPHGVLGGMWEFPGGKIEPGETAREALVREIDEELRCEVAVGDLITTTTHDYDFATITLTSFWCELVAGEPVLTEHAAVQWRAPDDLAELAWAPADIPAVQIVAAA